MYTELIAFNFFLLKLILFFLFSFSESSTMAANFKYISLVVLVLQNAALVLTMRYSRNHAGDMYFSTTAVVATEMMKLVTCMTIILVQMNGRVGAFVQYLYENIVMQPWDTLKLAVPSLIYTFQNNLLFVAVSNLSAATFQVRTER